ncbi:MAG: DUF1294 domain-containing protein [Oscillospiraceae bacterium]
MKENIIFWLLLLFNFASFAAFGLDKFLAVKGLWRIKEKTLLTFAAVGGFGATIGMWLFRHKTRKPKFYITLPLFCIADAVAVWLILGTL